MHTRSFYGDENMCQYQSTNASPLRSPSGLLLAMFYRVIVPLALLLTLVLAAPARAQCTEMWVPGFGTTGTNNIVNALAVLPGGDVMVGGEFTTAGGVPASRIARYNPTTGIWSALGGGMNSTNSVVSSLAVLPGGDVLVGGFFITAGGVAANNIARYNPSSNIWSSLGAGTSADVMAMAVLPSGDVIMGGFFTSAGGAPASRIARYNPTTGVWSALGLGTDNTVRALMVLPSGDVIVGGDFTTAGGVAANRVALYNPTLSVWSTLGTGTDNLILALAVLPSGDVIAGGSFFTAGGVQANRIARCNPTTGIWSGVGAGTNGVVNALAVLPGGDVLVGGVFSRAGGVFIGFGIARYNMTTEVWSGGAGAGTNGGVNALAVLPGGDVIVGGRFTAAGGVAANNIARYFPGSAAPSITTQPLPVVTGPSGSAFFGVTASSGSGSSPLTYQWRKGGVAINTIANPSAATPVLSLASVQAADIGSYTCLVTNSCGGTGTLSSAATLTFVAPPVSPACSLADVAGALSGGLPVPDGIVDGNDFIEFINAFAAGC